ncbi:unnamed protein product [Nesidiocoris tenuis]|uniref:Uncharacterized protein n=1 Tax=Nesidiocoris tenuis TaxID=355587 RepID=A0A6H5GQJ6_9HEMI|nr:unnamed protein product [Nesidiocoris tenuis]
MMLAIRPWVATISIFVFLCCPFTSNAWDSEDLEVFDVVEEVGQNFYEMLDISPDADSKAVKRAFRTLSLLLHPDKNPAADAEVKFRQLVAVHDILKDPNKRAKYDDVLVNGLPDWKQAIYYYRRVRKMGLVEMSVILFIIITIGQYCVAWAAYFEKKYTMVELEPIVTEPKKVKTRAKLDVEDSVWSPIQQKALEAALAAHPKGSTSDRWARIAAAVPGKSKEECIARYKLCHELVKKKKDEDTVIDANEAES